MSSKYKKDIVEEEKVKDLEAVFPLNVLRENCFLIFGVTISTFDGATAGIEQRQYTKSEVKEIIHNWLNKEVRDGWW